jgi:O-antigen ligase
MAALALAVPVLLASLALALPKAGPGAKWLSLAAFLLLLGGVGGIAAFSEAGSAETSVSTRSDIYQRTVPAILESFPVGTGLGSFERVYRLREDPAKVDSVFINHAHSDPLEWLLETGLPGLLLLLALLAWWLTRTVQLWRSEERELVPLAATIATAAILAHSLVDFPLRDPAIQALFALALALMAEPRSYEAQRRSARSSRGPAKAAKHLTLTDDGLVSA